MCKSKGMVRRILITLSIAVLVQVAWLLFDGFRKPELPADVAVVLGSKVHPSGEPSSSLVRRLERSLDLYRRGAVRAIVVSGGIGREGRDEAQVMHDFLVRAGVPSSAIVLDRTGNNTRLTAVHAGEIMRQHGWRSAVVVSQYYHVPRAKLALRQQGISRVTGAAAEYRFTWKDPMYVLRDSALYYLYLFGGGFKNDAAAG